MPLAFQPTHSSRYYRTFQCSHSQICTIKKYSSHYWGKSLNSKHIITLAGNINRSCTPNVIISKCLPSCLACIKIRFIAFKFLKINLKPGVLQNTTYMAELVSSISFITAKLLPVSKNTESFIVTLGKTLLVPQAASWMSPLSKEGCFKANFTQ